ncbi:MAG: cytidylate kinase family protein, partial [Synergistaceae bacterium]|nr:cytidylate kinase family protein [Synergistaceae bacterium]
RADYYEFYTGQKWGDKANYDLCVNTSCVSDLGKLARAVASMC